MKIILAQQNPVVGDIEANCSAIRSLLLEARDKKAGLVVFPELAVTGYPPRDLLERKEFAQRSAAAVRELAEVCTGELRAVVGFVEPNDGQEGKPYFNAAALLGNGRIIATYRKMLLPSYDVFDETRWFEPGDGPTVFEAGGHSFAVTICEDLWSGADFSGKHLYTRDPAAEAVSRGARFIINLSSSPYTLKKRGERRQVCEQAAGRCDAAILYCNQVGGNDNLIFDGGSFVLDRNGNLAACAREFEEDRLEIELDASGGLRGRIETAPAQEEDSLERALLLGLRDYVRKCRGQSVWLGLSGGIDSAIVAVLAARALGSGHVTCLSMPSKFSSAASVDDAAALTKNLGVKLLTIPIGDVFDSATCLLAPHFEGIPFGIAEENLQARIRGLILMAFSNKFGGLVLATGNKSEIAVGYCTLYGDTVGALAPIGDVYKTQVYALARHFNRDGEIIPENILNKAPSAELRPNQTDQDSLPPYDTLDSVLRMYIEEGMDPDAIAAEGFEPALVASILAMLRRAEYKRNQAALILKVSDKAFGPGRRYPIAQNYKNP